METLCLATLTVTSLLCVFSYEVTVRSSDLTRCKDDKVCVTNLSDCGPRPPSSVQKTLNMSCYYEVSHSSMTCKWSQDSNGHTESDVSLIFNRSRPVISCQTLFIPTEKLEITARIKSYSVDMWSQPHPVFLFEAIRPSPPALTVVGSTEDSIVVAWRSTSDGSYRLRYRANNTQTWSQAPDLVFAHNNPHLNYTIKDLLPFNVYIAAVACRETVGFWSDWSAGVLASTLERPPSRPPQVCYRLEKTEHGGRLLHLMWKALDRHDAGGRILGYQVSYRPMTKQQLQDRFIQNVTEVVASLEVEEGNGSVTVTAFNEASYGPSANLSIDTQRQNPVPSVRNMWVSSSFPAVKGLMVQWKISSDPPSALPVSHYDVQWRAETYQSTSRWSTVNGSVTSTLIQDVNPDESYLISVFPVYKQHCGSPQSLPASLQRGALMEANKLKVTGVNKTTVTVMWAWQRKSEPIRADGYKVMLRSDSEKQTQSLWPDQWQHTFLNLTPNTEYSLVLLADNVSRILISVRTDFDEVPVVATATPLLLLAVTVLIVSILSRTVYKGFFFRHVSSPRDSTAGQWLMDPNRKNYTEQNILHIKDFQETEILGVKSAIVVGPHWAEVHEDAALLPLGHLIKLSDLGLDTEHESDTPEATEQHLQHNLPDKREAALLHHQICDTNDSFPQREEDNGQLDRQTSQQAGNVLKCCFHELVATADAHCFNQITCEAEYGVSAFYLGKPDGESENGCSMICETDYVPNIVVLT